MKKILLSILFLIQNFLCFADCATPSEYVMQFLEKSGTKWRGDKVDWEIDLKNKKVIETNYLCTHDTEVGTHIEYSGGSVKAHDACHKFGKVPVDTVKTNFVVSYSKEDDSVTIKSNIEDTQVNKISEKDSDLKKRARLAHGKSEKQSDFCTECTYECTIDIDEKASIIRPTLHSICETKMPYEKFIEMMNKKN